VVGSRSDFFLRSNSNMHRLFITWRLCHDQMFISLGGSEFMGKEKFLSDKFLSPFIFNDWLTYGIHHGWAQPTSWCHWPSNGFDFGVRSIYWLQVLDCLIGNGSLEVIRGYLYYSVWCEGLRVYHHAIVKKAKIDDGGLSISAYYIACPTRVLTCAFGYQCI